MWVQLFGGVFYSPVAGTLLRVIAIGTQVQYRSAIGTEPPLILLPIVEADEKSDWISECRPLTYGRY
jgi:hypothetical protein